MPTRKLKKPAEGTKMPLTADMIAWQQEFEEMDLEAHKARLKSLGFDDDEIAEFEEMEEGAPLEDEIMSEGPLGKEEDSEKKVVKKKTAKK
ncbi:MAG: hypothetical protein WC915_01550 [archaeon]|jgi:hypothetical protein